MTDGPFSSDDGSVADQNVEVAVYWGDDWKTCPMSRQTWKRILEGEKVHLSEPYEYEGEEFTGQWHFNHSGPGSLLVGYDDGGTGFEGSLSQTHITINGKDWRKIQSGEEEEEEEAADFKEGLDALIVAIAEDGGYRSGGGVEFGIKLIRASDLDGVGCWSRWYVNTSNHMNPQDFSCWTQEIGGLGGLKRLWLEHSSRTPPLGTP